MPSESDGIYFLLRYIYYKSKYLNRNCVELTKSTTYLISNRQNFIYQKIILNWHPLNNLKTRLHDFSKSKKNSQRSCLA